MYGAIRGGAGDVRPVRGGGSDFVPELWRGARQCAAVVNGAAGGTGVYGGHRMHDAGWRPRFWLWVVLTCRPRV